MDDVTFSRNGPYGDSGVAIPGRCLVSMNVLFRERDEMSELRGVVYITKTRGQ